jgi:broad specificity phosphatase PhoE
MEGSSRTARRVAFVLLLAPALLAPPALPDDDVLGALPPLPSGALRVYLVRHGEALSNLDPVPDLPPAELDHLTERGRRQAEAAGRALAGRGVASVLASPASRARETADAMARALGLSPAAVEPRLRPMGLGRGSDGHTLSWKDRTAAWERGLDPAPPGGESMAQVGDRVTLLVRALARSRRGHGVVLVTHGEVLAAYLGGMRDIPAPKRYPPGLANGSVTVVDVAATGAVTIRLTNHRPAPP